jgi:hypothetical protein
VIVCKPIREDLVLVRIAGPEDGEKTRIQVRERIEILRVNVLDPLAILLRMSAIANADEQRSRFPDALERHCPSERTAKAVRPGMGSAIEAITASEPMQRKPRTKLRRRRRWQQQPNRQRRKRQRPEPA